MPEGKIYCGYAKEKTFDGGGSVVNVTLNLTELNKQFKEYGFDSKKECNEMIKICLTKRFEPDRYGNTHVVTVDTWKPDNNG